LCWLDDKAELASAPDSSGGKLFLELERLPFKPGTEEDEDIGMKGV
jgi:hypothetical protein